MTAFTREDFELAAKAAGLHDYAWSDKWLCMVKPAGLSNGVHTWSPPYDDGDALRLAARLNMTLCLDHEFSIPHVDGISFMAGDDLMKEVRAAIFRAAILRGRAMP